MSQSAVEAKLLRLFARPEVRELFERELARTHPILSNPQITYAPPGHFYSPLPDITTVEAEHQRAYARPAIDAVDLNDAGQVALLEELAQFAGEFDWPKEETPGRRYRLVNNFFEYGDALMLFLMIRRFSPKRIVEVGSGFSSALMLDVNERFYDGAIDLTFVEPHPSRLRSLFRPAEEETTRLLVQFVQDVPLETYASLQRDDILFIDSSHVSKVGSDVNHLFFNVLPNLAPGVLVHLHDIFYPFEYPLQWLQWGWSWNEAYLLRAFLQYNAAFQIQMFNSYMGLTHPELVETLVPLMKVNPGGSVWIRKVQ